MRKLTVENNGADLASTSGY